MGDEVTFEQTLAPEVQAYQDTLAQDAHDAQWAEAKAAHDLAVGTIDASTYAAQMSAAEGTQTADDAAAAALYPSQVGGATVTQIQTDADAALTDATLDAGAVKSASDADALAVQKYTKQESAAYEAETEEDASALEAEQVNVAQQEKYLAGQWNVNGVVYEDGNEVEGVPVPWGALMQGLAQANLNLVAGGTNADGSTYEGTAQAQQNLTDQQAEAQFTDEQSDADAQYTRDLAADSDQYNLTVGEAQATHDAQYALAASDQALVTAGAFPADLPGTSTAPDDGSPITASANYGLMESIGGYTIGSAGGDYQGLVGGMFTVGPGVGPGYAGWYGWYGWDAPWAPPAPAAASSGGSASGNSASPDNAGGTWSSDGTTPPPQAPQILAAADAVPGNGAKPLDESGNGGGATGGANPGGGTSTGGASDGGQQASGTLDTTAVMRLLSVLRPDVFQWFMRNGQLDTRDASSWSWFRFLLPNVSKGWHRPEGGQWVAQVIVDQNMTELEAAQAIIESVEGGMLNLDFAPPFKAQQALAGVDDFGDPEKVQKWREWVLAQTANAAAVGAGLYLEGIAGLTSGGNVVVGINEAFEGNYFAAALQLIPLLPFDRLAEAAAAKITFRFGKESVEMSSDLAAGLAKLDEADRLALLDKVRKSETADEAAKIILDILPHADASTLCFARNTPVACAEGLKPIGKVGAGDMVQAFDFATGRWVLAEVLKRHDNVYGGAVVTVWVGRSRIEATLNHPFWVVRGEELEFRRTPQEDEGGSDATRSLSGRWVLSQELQAGDLLFGHDRSYLRVDRIEQRYESRIEVSNLTIRGYHNFAVGEEPILAHNTGFCDILRKARGGYEGMTELIAAAKELGVRIHAHHIVPKGTFDDARGPFVERAQAILSKYTDVTYDTRNLTWALWRDHSIEYVRAVAKALEDAAVDEVVTDVRLRVGDLNNWIAAEASVIDEMRHAIVVDEAGDAAERVVDAARRAIAHVQLATVWVHQRGAANRIRRAVCVLVLHVRRS